MNLDAARRLLPERIGHPLGNAITLLHGKALGRRVRIQATSLGVVIEMEGRTTAPIPWLVRPGEEAPTSITEMMRGG